MNKMNTEQALAKMIEIEGWHNIVGYLLNIAFEQDLPELYHELDNIVVNYVPEVR